MLGLENLKNIPKTFITQTKTALNGFLNKCTWGLENAKEVLVMLERVELLISKTL